MPLHTVGGTPPSVPHGRQRGGVTPCTGSHRFGVRSAQLNSRDRRMACYTTSVCQLRVPVLLRIGGTALFAPSACDHAACGQVRRRPVPVDEERYGRQHERRRRLDFPRRFSSHERGQLVVSLVRRSARPRGPGRYGMRRVRGCMWPNCARATEPLMQLLMHTIAVHTEYLTVVCTTFHRSGVRKGQTQRKESEGTAGAAAGGGERGGGDRRTLG